MIIFYDKNGNIQGTVDSPFEDGFTMPDCDIIKIDKRDFSKEELKEFTQHKYKVDMKAMKKVKEAE